ncbi:MAG: GNAT family N-acetyltransferase [Anaerolineales bacterium]|nr:GNAT family N-acetyltransferase [Anaerolineales bacterium]
MFSLRLATADDQRAIRALIHQAQINPTGLNWRRFLLAVDEDNRVIGCGQIKPHRDGSRELASIAVAPDWRDQGVARRLIERLFEENTGRVYLTCREELGALYARFGFHIAGWDEMTPYFKRLAYLAEIIRRLHLLPGRMLVMVRDGEGVSFIER